MVRQSLSATSWQDWLRTLSAPYAQESASSQSRSSHNAAQIGRSTKIESLMQVLLPPILPEVAFTSQTLRILLVTKDDDRAQ
jgi:hypothetical protein